MTTGGYEMATPEQRRAFIRQHFEDIRAAQQRGAAPGDLFAAIQEARDWEPELTDEYLRQVAVQALTSPPPAQRGRNDPQGRFAYGGPDDPLTSFNAEDYITDLRAKVREGKTDPVIGRDDLVDSILEELVSKKKGSVLLDGQPGVGKSAIFDEIARRIESGECPPELRNRPVVAVRVSDLVAGGAYRGMTEGRTKAVVEWLVEKEAISCWDEFHTVIGAGAARGSIDISNQVKPELQDGHLKMVAATTVDEKAACLKDDAFKRRFEPKHVREPSRTETLEILRGLRDRYMEHHGVAISDNDLHAIIHLTERWQPNEYWPDKAVHLMDRSMGRASVRGRDAVTLDDVHAKLAESTRIEQWRLSASQAELAEQMSDELRSTMFGQPDAVEAGIAAMDRARGGVNDPTKPLCRMAFIGPPGTGKTMLAEQMATFLFGRSDALVRINMADPNSMVEAAEQVRKAPNSVVLFDETDKAHPVNRNALISVLGDGELRDNDGRTVDFRRAAVVIAGNYISEPLPGCADDLSVEQRAAIRAHAEANLAASLPEFYNRLEVIPFDLHTRENLERIAQAHLERIERWASDAHSPGGVSVTYDESLPRRLVENAAGLEGARDVQRAAETYVGTPLGRRLGALPPPDGHTVRVAVWPTSEGVRAATVGRVPTEADEMAFRERGRQMSGGADPKETFQTAWYSEHGPDAPAEEFEAAWRQRWAEGWKQANGIDYTREEFRAALHAEDNPLDYRPDGPLDARPGRRSGLGAPQPEPVPVPVAAESAAEHVTAAPAADAPVDDAESPAAHSGGVAAPMHDEPAGSTLPEAKQSWTGPVAGGSTARPGDAPVTGTDGVDLTAAGGAGAQPATPSSAAAPTSPASTGPSPTAAGPQQVTPATPGADFSPGGGGPGGL